MSVPGRQYLVLSRDAAPHKLDRDTRFDKGALREPSPSQQELVPLSVPETGIFDLWQGVLIPGTARLVDRASFIGRIGESILFRVRQRDLPGSESCYSYELWHHDGRHERIVDLDGCKPEQLSLLNSGEIIFIREHQLWAWDAASRDARRLDLRRNGKACEQPWLRIGQGPAGLRQTKDASAAFLLDCGPDSRVSTLVLYPGSGKDCFASRTWPRLKILGQGKDAVLVQAGDQLYRVRKADAQSKCIYPSAALHEVEKLSCETLEGIGTSSR